MGGNKLEKETIKISHEKFKEIIFCTFKSGYPIDYSDSFWSSLGLKRVDKFKNGGVYFEVVDKSKLIHAIIKYGFTI